MKDTAQPLISSPEGDLPSAVRWAHLLIHGRLRPGDWALDATAGNGHDTLFLAQSVSPGGRVFAFDVQAAALAQTRARLVAAGIDEHAVELLNCGHETLADVLPPDARGRVQVIMFNLGWLPGSDKSVITETSRTLPAIRAALEWLAPGGLMTVVVYPGHEGGADEALGVAGLAGGLSPRAFEVQHIRLVNRPACPPECWAFWKRH
ncbi:MAG: methyltransferase domain-containing protein [Verrucomicrobiaceae bacterium]|nr:methyltransferase domain-containing protein [Verrucomicrobiaceae bacterium]